MPAIELDLLGRFQLVRASSRLAVPPAAQRLLALIALNGSCARSTAAGSLWPESSEARARANLRTTLWRLPDGKPQVVRTDGGMIAIDPAVAVDVRALVNSVRRLGGGESMTVAEIHNFLHRPLELLPGWYDDWVLLERERLQQLWLHGLEAAAHRLGRLRRFDLAVDAAMLAIRIEPLRESAHRTLAELHLDEGNVGAAKRCYDVFARLLRDELGIAPSLAFGALVGSSAAASDRVRTGGTCGQPRPRATAPTSWGRPPSDGLGPRF